MDVDAMDERRPLLGTNAGRPEPAAAPRDVSDNGVDNGVDDFDVKVDADDPMEWPAAFKWSIVALLAFMAFTVTFTCISVVPVASRIVADLTNGGKPDKSASVLLVTIWELGEAAGPLFIAPLSEVYGRWPVLNVANALFIAATAAAALCRGSVSLFIFARALTGLAVASNVLNPAIVGDMFASEQRGSAMSLIMLAPLIGGAVGPAISGAVAQTAGWRQVLWLAAGLAAACELLFLTCFRETYVPVLRRRRAAAFGRPAADTGLTGAAAKEQSSSKIWAAVMRPAVVLFGSGVLMALSLFGSMVFAYFYVLCTSLPDILENIYDLPPALAGSAFMCFSIGSLVGVIICNLTLDAFYIRLRDSNGGVGKPEYRLPLVVFGAFTLPLAVGLYGWAAELRLPLPVLLLSVGLIGFTLLLAFLPLSAYVVDSFGLFSASAMTGIIVTRCLMGTFLPLTMQPLVDSFGYGWGFSILSLACLCLAPIPVLIMKYGGKWRQRSQYTRDQ